MPPIITVENLSKSYTIRHQDGGPRYRRLSEELIAAVKWPFRYLRAQRSGIRGQRSEVGDQPSDLRPPTSDLRPPASDLRPPASESFWALRDVSFDVQSGEVVGIIGRNGAGKSTLLKILSRITEPSAGRVRIRGRVASLLEVGTGFHAELTGRENIYLNGAILGMTRAEIRKKFDEIVAFAEVEKFLDTPVKFYSSGMYVRLAFAVAAHLDPEILIVDEVLAVGDMDFQKKCLGKMESVATQEGRTVLFVSHNMGAVSQLCSRGLLFGEGQLKASGTVDEVVSAYTRMTASPATTKISQLFRGPLSGNLEFTSITVVSDAGANSSLVSPSSQIRIEATGECREDIPAFRTTMAIFSNGVRLLSMHDVPHAQSIKAGSRMRFVFTLPAYFLRPADFFVALGGHSATNGEWLWATDLAQFTVLEEWGEGFRPYDTGLINIEKRGERLFLSEPDVRL